ncbi:hypothetical protein E2C01_079097 [Portunus trituberculatus]|uniref:Uncharacterized protein n=1 Tax=Portunus trituberculatus TaxID=210409 RepID=A0A5B7IQJ0_PORTR|nr:hypothetical protein [Portunus trituberculatus]
MENNAPQPGGFAGPSITTLSPEGGVNPSSRCGPRVPVSRGVPSSRRIRSGRTNSRFLRTRESARIIRFDLMTFENLLTLYL